jgi:L-lactate dehydrogenase complex protein LldG
MSLDAFTRAATAADAVVSVVPSPAAARDRVAEILRTCEARLATISPDAAAPPWACDATLDVPSTRLVVRSPAHNDRAELLEADAGVTVAAYGIADTGTLVLCASPGDHRLDSLAPPAHVALLRASALAPDLEAAFAQFAADGRFARHSAVTFVRGPSRTADIELQLTIGVHGPARLFVVVWDDRAGQDSRI